MAYSKKRNSDAIIMFRGSHAQTNNTFDNKFANGHPLQINYNTFYSQIQTVTGQSYISINISRSVSRLKSVFVSLILKIMEVQADLIDMVVRLGMISSARHL